MKITCCCLLLILGFAVTFAQTPDTLWTKIYGGAGNDVGYSIQQTSDNGYIIAGYTESFGAGGQDVWLLKTDGNGDTLWTKTYGGPDDDGAKSVQQTTDGGYIVAGYKGLSGADSADVWLLKTDENGDTIWTKTYGGDSVDRGHSVQQTGDGGYIITGYTNSSGAGYDDVYLVKTNSVGDTTWTRTYGGIYYDYGNSVQQTADGGYIITGSAYGLGSFGHYVYFIKTDSSGDTLWTKIYERPWSFGNTVQVTSDDGYIIAGATSYAWAFWIYLIKTDSSGDTLWTKICGGGSGIGYSVEQTTDGGYVVIGYSTIAGSVDVCLIKTDSSGDTLWTGIYGGTGYEDEGHSVQQTADGGYIAAGYTMSYGAGGSDVWILKIEPDVGIEEQPIVSPVEKRENITATIFRGPLQLPKGKRYRIYDVIGRHIHTANPAPGIYFIEVDGRLTQKVIKVR